MIGSTALVTGGGGFIGSHLVDRLIRDGNNVAVIDDFTSGRPANLNVEAELYEQDICSVEIAKIVDQVRPDTIFHLAAQISVTSSVQDPVRDARINLMGSLNLMEAVRGSTNPRFVFTSTGGAIYGEPKRLPVAENDPIGPISPYAASKFAVEQYLATYRAAYGFDYSILRLGNVYGPRQNPHGEAGVIAIFVSAMLAGEPLRIFGDGTDQRDYVYVTDAVDALVKAADSGVASPYNVGSGVGTDVNTIAERLSELTGYVKEPIYAERRDGDLFKIVLDATKANNELGWHPKIDFEYGLKLTVNQFRNDVDS